MPIQNFFRTSGSFSRFVNPFSGEDDSTGFGGSGPYCFYLVNDLTLGEGTAARATAPGSSATVRAECINGTEGDSQTGADIDIVDPATSARATIGGTWSASTGASPSAGRHVQISAGAGSPALDDTNISLQYTNASNDQMSHYGFGDRVANLLSGVSAGQVRYTTFGISDAVASTESFVQLPWPVAGTFQTVAMVYAVGTGVDDITLTLRLDGVDTALTFTLSDTGGVVTFQTNTGLEAAVTAGQLVSWSITQGTPTAGTFSCSLTCGFVP